MKRITIILMSIAALALASSCNKNTNPETPGDGLVYKTIHISASETLTNKAAFGEKSEGTYPLLWSEGDKVIICVNNDPNLTQELSVTPKDGGKSAEFEACTLALPDTGDITIRVTTNTTTASGGTAATVKYKPNVGESQAPQPASCDPESIILFAKETYSSAAVVPDKIEMSFSHATAYGLLNISGIDLGGETVKFVELQAMSPDIRIAGDVTIDGNGVLSPGSHTSLTMRGISDLSNPIWFAIAPSELNTASALAIHVVTSADRHFEKILDCSANPLKFQAGRISKFGVNFSGIASAARQVKTIRDLVLLKNALQNDDYAYWLNSDSEILLANDINYNNEELKGNSTTLHEGVTFNGQNYAIKNADISATIFKIVKGTVKNLKIEGGTNSTYLFSTVSGLLENISVCGLDAKNPLIESVSDTVNGLIVDANTTFTCTWPADNSKTDMGFVAMENSGLIENSEVSATINAGDPQRSKFNFGVFCPKCTSGRFYKCKNKGTVTLQTSTPVSTGCSLGGIVGIIESTQEDNTVRILEECENSSTGNISLILNYPGSNTLYHRICCVGGIAGGDYKGGTSNSGVWKDASYPSSGVIYQCSNKGSVTLDYNSAYVEVETSNKNGTGSQGVSIGGIVGATINDLDGCTNEGSVTANLNVATPSRKAAAPKIGGVVGAAHNKVYNCTNESTASVTVNGSFRNSASKLYAGMGPINQACIGGVAGCVGCGGSSATNTGEAATNSNNAESKIVNCVNKTASLTPPAVTDPGAPCFGAVCGWTSAYNTGNNDEAGTSWSVIGTSVASTPSSASTGAPLPK
ncbi:MAG: hypothetical protein IKH11_06540 [Bacteroidales bacterium]|nr:hypothetical protein [Bacteroidales bacterium]